MRTAKVFGGLLLALLLVKYAPLLTLFFRLSAYGLTAAAAAEYAGKVVTGKGFVSKYVPEPAAFAPKFNLQVLPHVAQAVEAGEKQVRAVVYAHLYTATLKAAAALFVLYKLTLWFLLFTLAVVVLVGAFTLPAVYVHNKTEIDAAVKKYGAIAHEKAGELAQKAHEQAKPHLATLNEKVGPYTGFITLRLPVRTAGLTVESKPPVAPEPEVATSTGASTFAKAPEATPLAEALKEAKEEVDASFE